MTPLGTERGSVQIPILRYASEIGWTYLPPDEMERLRGSETELLLGETFLTQAQHLNRGVVDHGRAEELRKRLIRVPPRIEGNLDAWEYLRGLKTVFVPEEDRERNVRLLDASNWEANTFHITDELRFYNGTHRIRMDVACFINGIPVLLVETKAATRVEGESEALEQVRRYHREGPELLALTQIYTLTHLIHYYYGPTWSTSRKALFNWRDEHAGQDFESLVKAFLHPQRLVRMLHDFILFTRKDDELSKVILRPHQMRAVERVVQRAADGEKQRGLVWHTQGSGKTYTMITTAKKIIEEPAFENPTVLMLVDRNELEAQLFGNLASVGFEHVEVARSKAHLRQLLARDRRGLIVSMIHKFDDIPAEINTRSNFFVLVDEAHRTTGGDLGNFLMGALPNATYIGFTGTPIDKTSYGKGTFKVFGADDPRGYLDKYSIAESIHDKTTVPLNYKLAPNDLRVEREALERDFLDLKEVEGVSDIEELNRVLEKAVTLGNMLKNSERMERIGAHVAEHYRTNVEPMGYKAFLVAVDREACSLYKDILDKHLPPEYSQVVYSPGHNDPPVLSRFHLSEDSERRIRQDFRDPHELPKILIVTEKLLTGFDAPILYCMYLDKPMRDHVLLQAIARVNRPYEDEDGHAKQCGFVLDYVGIFEKLEKALAFDSQDVEGVVADIDLLKKRFEELIKTASEDYLPITEGYKGDKAAEQVLAHFRDEEVRHAFYQFFRELEDLYEIISPDAFLRPFIEDYDHLARMYRLLRSAYESVIIDKELTRKTAKLVQEHTQTSEIVDTLEIYEINEGLLEAIGKDGTSDTVKIFNLLKSIQKMVAENLHQAPYLISIGERAEAIAAAFQERQAETLQALAQLEELIKEINRAEQERLELNMSPEAFAVYWLLNQKGGLEPETIARQTEVIFNEHPHWTVSSRQEREVRRALYKVILQAEAEERKGGAEKRVKEEGKTRELVDQIIRIAGRSGDFK